MSLTLNNIVIESREDGFMNLHNYVKQVEKNLVIGYL